MHFLFNSMRLFALIVALVSMAVQLFNTKGAGVRNQHREQRRPQGRQMREFILRLYHKKGVNLLQIDKELQLLQ